MKRLYIIIALVLWGCAQMASAQNMYRNYNTFIHPRTSVSVVHSNGYVYFFQADKTGILFAIEIDPLSMLPTGNCKFFDINNNQIPPCLVYLNGGFEDASGNFVLFGYRLQSLNSYLPQNPAYIIITSNLSSCEVHYDYNSYGEFTAGCDGHDINTGEVFMFVNRRELTVVEPSSPTSINILKMDTSSNLNDYFTDISWDAVHKKFIATGSAWNTPTGHECPFVEVFELLDDTIIIPAAEYYIDNQPLLYSNEYKSLHVQLYNPYI